MLPARRSTPDREKPVHHTEEQKRPSSLPNPTAHSYSRNEMPRVPGSTAAGLKPPPPLIQVSPSREKLTPHHEALLDSTLDPVSLQYRERLLQHVKDPKVTAYQGDRPPSRELLLSRARSPRDSRLPEPEPNRPVTVDLTRDRDTNSPRHPAGIPPRPSLLGVPAPLSTTSSARAQLKAMAMSALQENKQNQDNKEQMQEHHRKEESYLPPRPPDPKLGLYEKNEAIRKFSTMPTVCVSAPREFPLGSEYSQQYALLAHHYMRAQAAQVQAAHVAHAHPIVNSPYAAVYLGYPYRHGHEYSLPTPMSAPQLRMRDMAGHSVNGDTLPSQLKPVITSQHSHGYQAGIQAPPGTVSSYRALEELALHPHARVHSHAGQHSHAHEHGRVYHHPPHMHGKNVGEIKPVSQGLQAPQPRPHSSDIPEQELANPFVVQGYSSKTVARESSPDIITKRPGPSRTPTEPSKHQRMFTSPEKQQLLQPERPQTKSPTMGYLMGHSPKPVTIDEIRSRAAVIPELVRSEASGSTVFPDPCPAVIPTKLESRLPVETQQAKVKVRSEGTEKAKPRVGIDAFATLVDVAAAARKVEVPPNVSADLTTEEELAVKVSPAVSTNRSAPSPVIVSPTRVCSSTSPTTTSPTSLSSPRYGISTGLVPKPPPLMPITGVRPQDLSVPPGQLAVSTKEVATSIAASTSSETPIPTPLFVCHSPVTQAAPVEAPVTRSPGKLASPSGTQPPPLVPRAVSTPGAASPNQQVPRQVTSPVGPPPLISRNPSPAAKPEKSHTQTDTLELSHSKHVYLPRPSSASPQLQRTPQPCYGHPQPSDAVCHPVQSPTRGYHQESLPSDFTPPVVRNIFETVTYLVPRTNTHHPGHVQSHEQPVTPQNQPHSHPPPHVRHVRHHGTERDNRYSQEGISHSFPTQQADTGKFRGPPFLPKGDLYPGKRSLSEVEKPPSDVHSGASPAKMYRVEDDMLKRHSSSSGVRSTDSTVFRPWMKGSPERNRHQSPSLAYTEHLPSVEMARPQEQELQQTGVIHRGAISVISRDFMERHPDVIRSRQEQAQRCIKTTSADTTSSTRPPMEDSDTEVASEDSDGDDNGRRENFKIAVGHSPTYQSHTTDGVIDSFDGLTSNTRNNPVVSSHIDVTRPVTAPSPCPQRDASNQTAAATSGHKSDASLQVTASSSPVYETFNQEPVTSYHDITRPNIIMSSIRDRDLSDSDTLSAEELENVPDSGDEITSCTSAAVPGPSEPSSRVTTSVENSVCNDEDNSGDIHAAVDSSDFQADDDVSEDIPSIGIKEPVSLDMDGESFHSNGVSCSAAAVEDIINPCGSSEYNEPIVYTQSVQLQGVSDTSPETSESAVVDSTENDPLRNVSVPLPERDITYHDNLWVNNEQGNTQQPTVGIENDAKTSEMQVTGSLPSTSLQTVTSEAMSSCEGIRFSTKSEEEIYAASSETEHSGSIEKVESSDNFQTTVTESRSCESNSISDDLVQCSLVGNNQLAPDSSEGTTAAENSGTTLFPEPTSCTPSCEQVQVKGTEDVESVITSCSEPEVSSTPLHDVPEATSSDQSWMVRAEEDEASLAPSTSNTGYFVGERIMNADSSNDSKAPFTPLPAVSSSDEEDSQEYGMQLTENSDESEIQSSSVALPDSLEENEYAEESLRNIQTFVGGYYLPSQSESPDNCSTVNPSRSGLHYEAKKMLQSGDDPSISSSQKNNTREVDLCVDDDVSVDNDADYDDEGRCDGGDGDVKDYDRSKAGHNEEQELAAGERQRIPEVKEEVEEMEEGELEDSETETDVATECEAEPSVGHSSSPTRNYPLQSESSSSSLRGRLPHPLPDDDISPLPSNESRSSDDVSLSRNNLSSEPTSPLSPPHASPPHTSSVPPTPPSPHTSSGPHTPPLPHTSSSANASPSSHTLSLPYEMTRQNIRSVDVTESYFPHAEPISPAAPELPSHESENDRISPVPSLPSQWLQGISSPPHFASLPPLQHSAFPFSALSINVGSASNSARSSPIHQVHTSITSSPGSAVLPRQQEPVPLLSEHYEPLSDDEDMESD